MIAIISAFKSGLAPMANVERHEELRNLLNDESPCPYLECSGQYKGTKELGYIIFGIDLNNALEIARSFRQESIVYYDGITGHFIDVTSGLSLHQIQSIYMCHNGQEDYTEINLHGRHFRFSFYI